MKLFLTTELSKNDVYDTQLNAGFSWIRRRDPKHFADIMRMPTVGCYVEIYKSPYPGTIPLDSSKARAMIKKLCYF